MKTIEDLKREGWEFSFDKDTMFVSAHRSKDGFNEHLSICELVLNPDYDYNDLGNLIAHSLNSWGACKEGP